MDEGKHGDGDRHGGPEPAAHVHAHGPAAPVSAHLRKVIAAVLIPFAVAVVVGLAVLWPGGVPAHPRTGVGFDQQIQHGRVTKVQELPCSAVNPADQGTCQQDTVEVTTGPDKGRAFTIVVHPSEPRHYGVGEQVVLTYAPDAPPDLQYSVVDVDRNLPMGVLAGVFAVAVVAVGRWRGLAALVALAISFAVLSLFILPAILRGSDPLLVAIVGASAIMLIALYLCHGLSARTSVAVLGTLVSLVLIGVLSLVFAGWAHLTGNTSEETGLVHDLYPGIQIRGLLLAGFVIGSLGVLFDVTVTQTSAIWELHAADPGMGARKLYRTGMRIGRDHIASTVNTLVLAYAGAALPLLLLFSIAHRDVFAVATSELVAEEIARTLVGSIGLVASVPVTTALAALIAAADHPAAGASRHGRHRHA
ncbi:YibE/F family protein [Kitasatospora aureofaciens]|uniref:YibE/F family protein n=1 Tax=Kitasatospora aureofaciens TaxID=1894 RepID=UPI001C457648|nr:YibE/F family protein [Kitasatospora aureofaciens]MBV6700532.1 YibE/F family protein [Kitasatospora aureofaciens]